MVISFVCLVLVRLSRPSMEVLYTSLWKAAKGAVESNRSTMLFINMLNNVGLRLQPRRTPTKGVNVAVSPLFTFTAETTLLLIHSFQ